MKRKCRTCFAGNVNSFGKCDSCGAVEGLDRESGGAKSFYRACEMCGGEGRLVELGMGKEKISFYRCYDCSCSEYGKERQRRLGACPQCISPKHQAIGTPDESKYWTPAEANYQRALHKYYLRPLYYNKEPDLKMLQKYADAVSAAPVVKIEEEAKQWFD